MSKQLKLTSCMLHLQVSMCTHIAHLPTILTSIKCKTGPLPGEQYAQAKVEQIESVSVLCQHFSPWQEHVNVESKICQRKNCRIGRASWLFLYLRVAEDIKQIEPKYDRFFKGPYLADDQNNSSNENPCPIHWQSWHFTIFRITKFPLIPQYCCKAMRMIAMDKGRRTWGSVRRTLKPPPAVSWRTGKTWQNMAPCGKTWQNSSKQTARPDMTGIDRTWPEENGQRSSWICGTSLSSGDIKSLGSRGFRKVQSREQCTFTYFNGLHNASHIFTPNAHAECAEPFVRLHGILFGPFANKFGAFHALTPIWPHGRLQVQKK